MSSKKNAVDVSTVETGASMVARGDEADLARMGYKQELKCVLICCSCEQLVLTVVLHRRDLSLLQVCTQ